MRNVRRRIFGCAGHAALWVLPRLPRWSITMFARGFVAPVARLMFRRQAEANLRRVYGDELTRDRLEQILRGVFRNVGSLVIEWTRSMKHRHEVYAQDLDDAEARRRIAALEKVHPRGWIGVSAHLGNWEFMAAWATWSPAPGRCFAVAKRLSNPRLNEVVEECRRRLDVRNVYRDDPPTRFVRLLREGARLGIVPDQDVPSLPGVFIDFFGSPAYTPIGPARLALAADVPLVPCGVVRVGDGFRVEVREPIFPDRSRPRDEEVLRLTRAWSAAIERMILDYPEQWMWFHQRWRTTPEKLAARGRPLVQRETEQPAAHA